MQQLMFEEAGRYAWRDAPDPEISDGQQALVRPLMVACCDLDVAVAEGALPMPPGHAVGHEGLAEVVAVGDEVTNVRRRRPRRRAVSDQLRTVQRVSPRRDRFVRVASADGDVRHGATGRSGRRRVHVRSRAGAVRRRDAAARSRGRRPGGDRLAVGQHPRRLARDRSVPRGIGRPRRGRPPHARGRSAVDRLVRRGVRSGVRRAGRLRRHRRSAARHGGEARRPGARPAEAG